MLEGARARMSKERSDESGGDSTGWGAVGVSTGERIEGHDSGGSGGDLQAGGWAAGGSGAMDGLRYPSDAQVTEAFQVAVAAGPRWVKAFTRAAASGLADAFGDAAMDLGVGPEVAMDSRRAWERRRRGESRSPSGDGGDGPGDQGLGCKGELVGDEDSGRPRAPGAKRPRGRGLAGSSAGPGCSRKGGGQGKGRHRGRPWEGNGKGSWVGGLGHRKGKGARGLTGGRGARGRGLWPGLMGWQSEAAGRPQVVRLGVRDQEGPHVLPRRLAIGIATSVPDG